MKKKITMEDLAVMIAKGFEKTATKGELELVRVELKQDIKNLEKSTNEGFDRVESRLDGLELDSASTEERLTILEKSAKLKRH